MIKVHMVNKIRKHIEDIYPHIVEIRRNIHNHPELKLNEYITSGIILGELESAGWNVYPGYADTTAVIAVLAGGKKGPIRAFRADMDALPIKEETNLPYSSKIEGIMHACGHDFHTSILIGLAYILKKEQSDLPGKIVLVFQPGEEGGFGARILTEAGLIDDFKIEYIIGQHLFPEIPICKIQYRFGVMNANTDSFQIIVTGKGGHAARPNTTIDPIAIAIQIYSSISTVHFRELSALDPCVITVGSFNSGTTSNIIPEKVFMKGTVRSLSTENREFVLTRIREIAENTAQMLRGSASVEIHHGYPSVVNDYKTTEKIIKAANIYLGDGNIIEMKEPSMGGEDFSYYLQKIPGCMYRIGSGDSGPLHSNRFAPDENVLKVGMGINCITAFFQP